jgi:predicted acetyltransferase
MENIKLIIPDIKYEKEFINFINDFKSTGEKLIPFILKFYKGNIIDYVNDLLNFSKGIGVPEGLIEHSTFWLKNDFEILGVINIRHRLNDLLIKQGGHIGFGISPKNRKKGYGKQLLKLGLIESKKIGINRVLLTCDKNNVGSSKVIIYNGGVLDSEELIDNKIIQRYWIDNKA